MENKDIEYSVDLDYDIKIDEYDDSDNSWSYPSIPAGVTISFGPIEMIKPPDQPDMFRHYISSQWMHSSHIADEDPQWQCESWIDSKPHLKEAHNQGCLEIAQGQGDDDVDYFFVGTEKEYLFWKLRWSEYL